MSRQNRYRKAAFFTHLISDNGYLSPKDLGDGTYACVMPLMFTHAIIRGRIGDLHSYEDRWCYKDRQSALKALEAWDGTGEPEGWHRHPMTGRRRETNELGLMEETINP
jgi:hypothetical protein